mmetsp:Transcript_25549/g.71456  ORF Transcript_25549/g.71456 Transcript_25549/m.71456 type:complete len:381 (+) Transcript_25549:169-1311(+)
MEGGEQARAKVADQPMDCCFHPTCNLMAAAIITGKVQVFRCEGEAAVAAFDLAAHSDSCRAVRFTGDGAMLLSASADCSILATDTASGTVAARLEDAHADGINRLECVEGTILASGDDEGLVKLWDLRQRKAVGTLEAHSDFVSDFYYTPERESLLSVSGDGTLVVTDLRTRKVAAQSEEDADDELLSVVVVKDGKKVVCGSQEGALFLYSWGYWNDCSDRFPGHPNSIDAMVKFDEDTIITGSSDGIIRIINILPNKLLGVVGEHADYPVECVALSGDRKLLASASHDNTVKIWDIAFLQEEGSDEECQAEPTPEEAQVQKAAAAGDDSDMADSSDEAGSSAGKRRKGKGKHEKTKMKGKGRGKKAPGGSRGSFFADLL